MHPPPFFAVDESARFCERETIDKQDGGEVGKDLVRRALLSLALLGISHVNNSNTLNEERPGILTLKNSTDMIQEILAVSYPTPQRRRHERDHIYKISIMDQPNPEVCPTTKTTRTAA
jgi:hypothetical protein